MSGARSDPPRVVLDGGGVRPRNLPALPCDREFEKTIAIDHTRRTRNRKTRPNAQRDEFERRATTILATVAKARPKAVKTASNDADRQFISELIPHANESVRYNHSADELVPHDNESVRCNELIQQLDDKAIELVNATELSDGSTPESSYFSTDTIMKIADLTVTSAETALRDEKMEPTDAPELISTRLDEQPVSTDDVAVAQPAADAVPIR